MSRLDSQASIISTVQSGDPLNEWNDIRESQIKSKLNRHLLASEQGNLFQGTPIAPRKIPLVGWSGLNYNETDVRPYSVPIEIPSGITEYSILVHVDLFDNGTQVEDIEFQLIDPSTFNSQTILHVFASGAGIGQVNLGTGDLHYSTTGTLNTQFQPNAGDVMAARLTITPNMTNPRTSVSGGSAFYTGLLQVVLVGY